TELQTFQRWSLLQTGLSVTSGVFNMVGGLSSDNRVVQVVAGVGGAVEISGGLTYLVGAVSVGTPQNAPKIMAFGSGMGGIGGGFAGIAISGYSLIGDYQRGDVAHGIGDGASFLSSTLSLCGVGGSAEAAGTLAVAGSWFAGGVAAFAGGYAVG